MTASLLLLALAGLSGLGSPLPAESLNFGIVPRQSEPWSCGHATAAGVLRLAGIASADEAAMINASPDPVPDPRLDLVSMDRLLEAQGLGAKKVWIEEGALDEVISKYSPLVLHLESPLPHFVLSLGMAGGLAVIADPADGLVAIDGRELKDRASGYALLTGPVSQGDPWPDPAGASLLEDARSRAFKTRKTLDFLADIHAEMEMGIEPGSGRDPPRGRLAAGFDMEMAPEWILAGMAGIRLPPGDGLEDLTFSAGIEYRIPSGMSTQRMLRYSLGASLGWTEGRFGPSLRAGRSSRSDPFIFIRELTLTMDSTRLVLEPALRLFQVLNSSAALQAGISSGMAFPFDVKNSRDASFMREAAVELAFIRTTEKMMVSTGVRISLMAGEERGNSVFLSIGR
jgi:hypothetical protein